MVKYHGLRRFLPKSLMKTLTTVGLREVGDLSLLQTFSIVVAFIIILIILISSGGNGAEVYKSMGNLNMACLSLLLLPVTRHGPILSCLGISFESILKFHRALGMFAYCVIAIHGFGMWYSYANTIPGASLALAMEMGSFGGSNLSGFLAFCMATVGIIAAYSPIRRLMYETFYYVHISCAVLTYVFAVSHRAELMIWLFPSLLLYTYDIIKRMYQYRHFRVQATITPIYSNKLKSSITRLVIDASKYAEHKLNFYNYKPGQYYMITIPSISPYESHPFSVSSASLQPPSLHTRRILPLSPRLEENMTIRNKLLINKNLVTFHIQNNNIDGSWSSQLHEKANKLQFHKNVTSDSNLKYESTISDEENYTTRLSRTNNTYGNTSDINTEPTIEVILDGPFGSTFQSLCDYETLIFCCGGIGATPAMSIIYDILQEKELLALATTIATSTTTSAPPPLFSTYRKWDKVKHIYLIWSCRDATLFQEFQSIIHELYVYHGETNIFLYHTRGNHNHIVNILVSDAFQMSHEEPPSTRHFELDGIKSQPGRPDYHHLLPTLILQKQDPTRVNEEHPVVTRSKFSVLLDVTDKYDTSASKDIHIQDVGVFACGPTEMVQDIQNILVSDPLLAKHSTLFTEEFYF